MDGLCSMFEFDEKRYNRYVDGVYLALADAHRRAEIEVAHYETRWHAA